MGTLIRQIQTARKNDSNGSSQDGSLKVWTWNLGRPAAPQGQPRVNMFLKCSSRPGGAETSFHSTESRKIGVPSGLHLLSVPQLLRSSLGVFLDCLLLPQQDPFFHNGALLQAGRGRRAFTLHYFCFLLFCQSHGHPHCHRKLPGVWSGDRLVPPILAPDPVSHRGNLSIYFFILEDIFLFCPTVGVSHSKIIFFFPPSISRFCKLLRQCTPLSAAPGLGVPVSSISVFSRYNFCVLCLHEFFMMRWSYSSFSCCALSFTGVLYLNLPSSWSWLCSALWLGLFLPSLVCDWPRCTSMHLT